MDATRRFEHSGPADPRARAGAPVRAEGPARRQPVAADHLVSPSGQALSVEESLQAEVVRLREELRGVRAAQPLRAVIEQAKGVIAERDRIGPEEAFVRLRAMSQQHNVRLAEVAATVVGVALGSTEPDLAMLSSLRDERLPSTSAMSSAWRTLREEPQIRAGVQGVLVDSLVGAATTGDAAAELVRHMWTGEPLAAVTIYRRLPDGGLAMIGQSGLPPDVSHSWRTIPPMLAAPPIVAVHEDRCFFWVDRKARLADFPQVTPRPSAYEGVAILPIHESGEVIGMISLLWTSPQSFPAERRRAFARVADALGPRLLRTITGPEPRRGWLTCLLQVQFDPWILLRLEGGQHGSLHTLAVTAASPDLPRGREWVGHRLLELWPGLAGDPCARVLLDTSRGPNATCTTTVSRAVDAPWGGLGTEVRSLHLRDQTVVMWRRPQAPGS